MNMAEKRNSKPQKAKLKELQEENRRLSAEVDALKRELEKIRGKKQVFGGKTDASVVAFERQAVNEELFRKNYYGSYFIKSLGKTTGFSVYERLINALKKYNFVKITMRVLTVLFAMIQSGTIFILTTSAVLVSLPVAFFLSGAAFLLTYLLSGLDNRRNMELLRGKDVTIFFPPKGEALSENSFFAGFVSEAAAKENGAAIIVSPYAIRPRGIGKKRRFYIFSRSESDNILIVRRHYFFRLRKRVILPAAGKISMIY